MTSLRKRTFLALGALLAALPLASVASGQTYDEFGDATNVDVIQTVARISHFEGTVSYERGDDPDNWQPADLNVPMTLGDRIYTSARSRAEVQVHGGDVIWLGSRTDLTALNLTDDTKQFALKLGVGSFHVRRVDGNDLWEVDTPNAAVTFEQPGDYRISVDADGNTRVSVQRGTATVAAGGGEVNLNAGEAMVIDGIENPRYDVVSVSSPDPWDQWVRGRSDRVHRSVSYQYVSADVVGVDDLDAHGTWGEIPNYGMVWSPARVEVGWAPYREGHWVWQDPWGWTWVSTEPWGWAPYHYGRWVTYSSRWYWVPVGPSVRAVAYAPALVAFVGGSPGFSASVTIGGGGYVGWFPLAPREQYVPWWAPQPAVNVNVTNVTYVNRTYVTVVNQNTFVSGGLVARNVVTDRTVVRQVATAPVIHGAVPVLPTNASLRASVGSQAAAPRPPAAVLARPVVARVAPPPAPPSFQQKVAVIRENRRPVDPISSARIAVQAGPQPRAAVPVRPVVAEQGRVTLAPRSGTAPKAPRPVPEAPVRGRPASVPQQPVAPGLVTGPKTRLPLTTSPGATAPEAGRPGVPDQRPAVERDRVEPSRVPPTPIERQREVAPESRPDAGRQRVPVPRQPDVQPTPGVEQPIRPGQPANRVRPDAERAQTPNWRDRSRPTPRIEQPSGAVAPQRERVQQEPPQRERVQQQPPQRQEPPQGGRVETPPPSREVVRPDSRRPPERPSAARPDERAPRSQTPRPRPTPRKADEGQNPN